MSHVKIFFKLSVKIYQKEKWEAKRYFLNIQLIFNKMDKVGLFMDLEPVF